MCWENRSSMLVFNVTESSCEVKKIHKISDSCDSLTCKNSLGMIHFCTCFKEVWLYAYMFHVLGTVFTKMYI